MHEPRRGQGKKLLLSRENAGIFLALLIAAAFGMFVELKNLPSKWITAIYGTVVPFPPVVVFLHLRWRRWSFWAALMICLVIHTVAIWCFFQYALSDSQTIGLLLWFPIALVEIFVLFVAVKRIEEKLTGKKETYILD